MSDIIDPKILKGTRDFMPLDQVKREAVLAKIRAVFQRFGYAPIETPILSYASTIMGKYGDEGDKLTYTFEDHGGRQIALPYDLTVPTARYVAANWNDLPMPFKRYQIQRVWRAEKPQKGRLREFYQCDIDVIGTNSLTADVEVAKVIIAALEAVGLPSFVLKVNSRRLMNQVLADLGLADVSVAVIRSIDKLDKIGKEGVLAELEKEGFAMDKINQLFDLCESRDFSDYDTSEIDTFMELAEAYGIPKDSIEFDPYLARGLDYYTGMVFEAVCPEAGMGSVAGGGRYDNLCGTFTKEQFSGVGASLGFERIMLALEDMGKLDDIRLSTDVLVTQFDADGLPQALSLVNDLTAAGINAEVYFEDKKLGKQFKYADKKNIPFVVVQGPEEREAGNVSLKNMASGEQLTVTRDDLIAELKQRLAQ